jgi:excisionase family DNA binding protein
VAAALNHRQAQVSGPKDVAETGGPLVAVTDPISATEAAEILGVSRTWIGRLIDDGTLVGERLHSRAILVSRASAVQNALAYAKASRKARRRGRPRSNA